MIQMIFSMISLFMVKQGYNKHNIGQTLVITPRETHSQTVFGMWRLTQTQVKNETSITYSWWHKGTFLLPVSSSANPWAT